MCHALFQVHFLRMYNYDPGMLCITILMLKYVVKKFLAPTPPIQPKPDEIVPELFRDAQNSLYNYASWEEKHKNNM